MYYTFFTKNWGFEILSDIFYDIKYQTNLLEVKCSKSNLLYKEDVN